MVVNYWKLCFIIFILNFNNFICNEDIFVISKSGDPNYYCITKSTYALSWIPAREFENNTKVSVFIPKTNETNLDWEINENEKRTKSFLANNTNWSLKKSLDSNLSDIIFDRRWEEMVIHKTGPELEPVVMPFILKENFVIPFSIRTEGDAQIYLCDGKNISESNCYEFKLQYTRKQVIGSGIFKHQQNDKNVKVLKYVNHFSFLLLSSWTHLKLTKTKNNLKLTQKYKGKKIFCPMQVFDQENPISTNYMIIKSEHKAFWKIHEVDFIYTNKTEKNLKFDIKDDSVCLSLFVWMCRNCTLIITLNSEGNSSVKIKEEEYEWMSNGWREIKFIAESIKTNQTVLSVSTNGTGSDNDFWVIDKIRHCQREEFRMIQTIVQSNCQLITKENDYGISTNNTSNVMYNNTEVNKCLENTITKFCIPCIWFPYINCRLIKICERNNSTQCSCSAGYYHEGGCTKECELGTFGYGCKKKCGKCINDLCNNDDGACPKCTENYVGTKCDTHLNTAFLNAPETKNISYTDATVQMTNFSYSPVNIDGTPKEYIIQYKQELNNNNSFTEWLNVSSKLEFSESIPLKINNLTALTSYYVRSIIISDNGKMLENGSIKTVNFTTKCYDFTDQDITVIPKNISAEIIVNEGNGTCKLRNFKIELNKKITMSTTEKKNYFFINKLHPYSEYKINIEVNFANFNKTFQTSEGVPEPVRNLTATNVLPNKVTLNWNAPSSINGNFSAYVVNFKISSFQSCKQNSISKSWKNNTIIISQNTFITLNDLTPYSNYEFSVSVKNNEYESQPSAIYQSTPSLNEIHQDEIPDIVNLSTEADKVKIEFSKVDCTKIQGKLFIKINAKCFEEWCSKNETKKYNFDYDFSKSEYTLMDLVPFSRYHSTIQFCRNESLCSDFVTTKTFESPSTVPSMVLDLLIYSKDNSSISLRWKPPYPPTGELIEYQIRYHSHLNDSYTTYVYIFSEASCKLWPNFVCYKLSNLKPNSKYNITVRARNKSPSDYGQASSLSTETKKEKPEVPSDLHLNWTLNNDLKLSWKPPIVTNGDIQYYNITISTRINDTEIVNDYNATKTALQVDADTFQPSTLYSIEVAAYNDYLSKSVNITEISPPSIPALLNNDPKCFPLINDTIKVGVSFNETQILPQNIYKLYLLQEDNSENSALNSEPEGMKDILNLLKLRILHQYSLGNGNNMQIYKENFTLNVTDSRGLKILFTNNFLNKTSYKIYDCNYTMEKNFFTNNIASSTTSNTDSNTASNTPGNTASNTASNTTSNTGNNTASNIASNTANLKLYTLLLLCLLMSVITITIIALMIHRKNYCIRKYGQYSINKQEKIPLSIDQELDSSGNNQNRNIESKSIERLQSEATLPDDEILIKHGKDFYPRTYLRWNNSENLIELESEF